MIHLFRSLPCPQISRHQDHDDGVEKKRAESVDLIVKAAPVRTDPVGWTAMEAP
jgi:hypothetical protein